MKAWDIYTADIFGEHPCVLVSCQARIDAKPEIVVLGCRTMRPASEREPRANEVVLDSADGLDLKTLCRCDLLFTLEKAIVLRNGVEARRIVALVEGDGEEREMEFLTNQLDQAGVGVRFEWSLLKEAPEAISPPLKQPMPPRGNPQASSTIFSHVIDHVVENVRIRCTAEGREPDTIEPGQASQGADPEIPIAGLLQTFDI